MLANGLFLVKNTIEIIFRQNSSILHLKSTKIKKFKIFLKAPGWRAQARPGRPYTQFLCVYTYKIKKKFTLKVKE